MSSGYLQRTLPAELQALSELSLDLRLTGSHTTERIWERLDPDAWDRVKNPSMILQHAHQERLKELAEDEELKQQLAQRIERRRQYLTNPGWFDEQHAGCELKGVAYFSMEFGLSEALPIYSGGLGILAGDHLKSASDLNVPIYGIGLLYQQGYFRQVLADDGWQLEAFPFNDPGTLPVRPVLDADGRWPRVRLELPGRTLFLRVWRAQVGRMSLYLLDSNHPLNSPWDRGITANLYAAGKEKRLLQELVLGVGGWRLLEKLGLDAEVCHLNEGHAAFAVLARAASFAARHQVSFEVARWATRAGNVFTTHTPVEAAFDQFEPSMLAKYAQPFVESAGLSLERVLAMGRHDPRDERESFNMAYLALRNSGHINAVSRLHGRVSRSLFQTLFPAWPRNEIPVGHITNGVHVPTWDSIPTNRLWREAYSGQGSWVDDLQLAERDVSRVSDERLWDFRAEARATLVHYVRRRLERQLRERGAPADQVQQARHVLDPNCLTLGFARRFATYKRPTLLLYDAERFARFLKDPQRPAQIIMAGKAHPNDDGGKAMVQAVARYSRREDLCDRVVFLEDYDIALAQHFAAGIDVWLNSPRRPNEACGTSGMKMMANGGLHCSILDGWWDEAYTAEVGFKVSDDAEHQGERDAVDARQMYQVLEDEVAPEFYDRDEQGIPRAWIQRVRASMSQLTSRFSSQRMVQEYTELAYLPAAQAFQRRTANDASLARELHRWSEQMREGWHGVRFGNLEVRHVADEWHFCVQAYLGELPREFVQVQLYRESDDVNAGPIVMEREGPIRGAINGYTYAARVPADCPAEHYTPRIVPFHPEALVPLEDTHLHWLR